MHDRIPGAPGQYKAIITAEELLKMQSGKQFVITMTRDDHPLAEGTPYNKASVLPDDVANLICPKVTDPTPADAFMGLLARRYMAVLTASGWSGSVAPYTQTIALEDVGTADCPRIGPVYDDNPETAIAQKEAWSLVTRAKSSNGSITFSCFEGKPQVGVPIQIEVVR